MHGRIKTLFELLVITVAAFFLADACRTIMSPHSAGLPAASAAVAPSQEKRLEKPALKTFAVIEKRNLLKAADPLPPPAHASAPKEKNLTELPLSKLNIKLLGTIQSSDPAISRAILLDGSKQLLSKTGDAISGFTVREIHRRAVVMERDGKRELLIIDTNDAEVAQKAAASSHNVSRREVQASMNNLGKLAREVSLSPATKSGSKGLLITRLQSGSLLHKLGLRDDDLITSANGNAMRSFADLGSLASALKGDRVSIDILRDNSKQTLTFNLVP